MRQLSATESVVYGGLVVAGLDALDAIVVFGARGTPPVRIFQGIAAGALGRASFQGGVRTALLGLAFHFFIGLSIAATYFVLSRTMPVLVHRPVVCGAIYGVAVYFFMNRVVIPLSAIGGGGAFNITLFLNGILIHVFGIGIPAALFSAQGPTPRLPTAAGSAPSLPA
jgi:hypothetical protein